jgi:hypothetical protein
VKENRMDVKPRTEQALSDMEITPAIQQALSTDASMLATVCRAVKERWGDEGMTVLRDAMERQFAGSVALAAKAAGARINTGTIEDWVKLEKYFGKFTGIDAEFEVTPTRGLLRMTKCPYAKQYGKVFAATCPDVLIGCERAIAHTINPHLHVRGQKYMTSGDAVCELVVEWDKDYKPG